MSQLSSECIVISSARVPNRQGPGGSGLANAAVLELLMPQLIARKTYPDKARQRLENTDYYMLEETELLLVRLSNLCLQLGMAEDAHFKLVLLKGKLKVPTHFEQATNLVGTVLQDSWITGAFNWLAPNYIALAYSQELLSFAQAYEKNRRQALVDYSHLEQGAEAMHCYVDVCIEQGKVTLCWCVQSPVTNYQVVDL